MENHGQTGGVSDQEYKDAHEKIMGPPRQPVRAVAFGGGGPAVGISIGFLLALQKFNLKMNDEGKSHRAIEFPVWVAGCVGGWLTCLHHVNGRDAEVTRREMRKFFREDRMYDRFPAPTTFTPDLREQMVHGLSFLADPRFYDRATPDHLVAQMVKGYWDMVDLYLCRDRWNWGDFSHMMLNSMMAPNPAVRLLMGLLYKSPVTGLNKLWFNDDYSILKNIDLTKLQAQGTPDLYINSYNFNTQRADIYRNHPPRERDEVPTRPLKMEALCASSALPYIFAPVDVDGEPHCEGALLDSFCFEAVHRNRRDINEVWISRIVDHGQIKKPENLLDALNNLIMLYAGTTSERDVESFVNDVNRRHLLTLHRDPTATPPFIECHRLPVLCSTNYYWNHTNFDDSVRKSEELCAKFIDAYNDEVEDGEDKEGRPIALRRPRFLNAFIRRDQWFSEREPCTG